MNKLIQKAALAAILALGALSANGQQYYSLDSTFGSNGIKYVNSFYTLHDMSNPVDMIVLNDGKFICCYNDMCHNFLMRFNADGTLDNTFQASVGYEVYPTPTPGVVMFTGNVVGKNEAIVRQTSTGKILMMFSGYGIFRLNNNGSFDGAFDLSSNNPLRVLQYIQSFYESGSSYYFAGKVMPQNSAVDTLLVVKTNTSGVRDNSYGTGGVKMITLDPLKFGEQNNVSKVTLTSDGKLMFVGRGMRSAYPSNGYDIFVAKYNLDGTPVSSFGTNGVTFLNFNSTTENPAVFTTNVYGDIFVAGTADGKIFTTKLFANGTLDQSFGTAGETLHTPAANCQGGGMFPYAIAATSGSKVFLTGFYNPSINVKYDEFLSYNADGSPNTDFGPNGIIYNNNYERVNTLLTTADNQVLAFAADTHARIFRFKGDPDALTASNIQAAAEKVWVAGNKAYMQIKGSTTNASVTLISSDGKLVRRYSATELAAGGKDIHYVQLPSDLPQGVYVLSVQNNSRIQQVKFSY